jgi:threonine synthase
VLVLRGGAASVPPGADASLARSQRYLGDPEVEYPLWPPLAEGCPETSTEEVQYPVEVSYDHGSLDAALFGGPSRAATG